jgi:AcrR family transcriptional regulator
MTKSKELQRSRGRPPANAQSSIPEPRILQSALQAFAQWGYNGMTMSALARRLKVSHNLLHIRFGGKEELWRRSIDARVAIAFAPVLTVFDMAELDAEGKLRELVLRHCQWTFDNPELVSITHFEGRHSSWRLDYLVDAYVLPFTKRLETLLKEVSAVRSLSPVSTFWLMSMIGQGVGFYLAAGPMLARLGAAREIGKKHRNEVVQKSTDFILAALLPSVGDQATLRTAPQKKTASRNT